MTVYYFENTAYNGILVTDGRRWFEVAGEVDGIVICRANIPALYANFVRSRLDLDTFEAIWQLHLGHFCWSDEAPEEQSTPLDELNAQDYHEPIYIA